MLFRTGITRLSGLFLCAAMAASIGHADTLVKIVSAGSQGGNDSLSWSQKGADQTVLPTSFSATTALSTGVTVGLAAPNSVVSVVCTATPCSWTGTGFTAGDSLLWTSDAGNGGSGPVALTFANHISGAGAMIQANTPGAFTAQVQLFNGTTSLGSFTQASDAAGDPLYLGAVDQTAANVTQVVFSLTACSGVCTDFGIDTVAVNATASASSASVSPGSLAFASTAVGSTSASQTVTLTNTGTTTLSITSITSSGSGASSFLLPTNGCGTTLAASASCTFTVAFKPATSGALSAVILVTDSATGSPQQVNVSGTGTASSGSVSVTPSSLTFAVTNVGSVSGAQLVTVKNLGPGTLTVSSLAVGGTDASSFLVGSDTCTGVTLPVGSHCTFNVSFKPTAAGALSASVLINDNASGSPQTLPVSGTGRSTGLTVSLTPSSMAFATTAVGSTSASQTATLTNTGATSVNITSILSTGTNASSFLIPTNACGSTLAASASCTFTVAFKPTAAGALSGAIQVTDNASGSPQSVAVSGTGQSAAVTVTLTPSSMAFGTITVGATSPSQTATLTNTGSSVVNITSIASTGANASSFLIPTNACGSTLAVGANCTFTVAFKPTAAGALSAAIQVTDNATGSPQSVSLSGTGQTAGGTSLTINPSSLAFGSDVVGTTTPAQIVTISNPGSSAITITGITLTGANPTSFIQLNTCGASIAPSASCTVAVSFKAASATALSASLSVASSGTGSPQTVALSGTGTTAPTLSFSPTSVAFPATLHGTATSATIVTITNTGTVTANLAAIVLGGATPADFSEVNDCGPTLATGAACHVYVSFKPNGVANYSATVVVYDDAINSPQSIGLTGSGN